MCLVRARRRGLDAGRWRARRVCYSVPQMIERRIAPIESSCIARHSPRSPTPPVLVLIVPATYRSAGPAVSASASASASVVRAPARRVGSARCARNDAQSPPGGCTAFRLGSVRRLGAISASSSACANLNCPKGKDAPIGAKAPRLRVAPSPPPASASHSSPPSRPPSPLRLLAVRKVCGPVDTP
ncbi:hypothetical protein BC628DRAFT_627572 [Trametes gibbosa]|nr:hypothetical protein BC628DRAFT_627572 [Trametes gibbosa]